MKYSVEMHVVPNAHIAKIVNWLTTEIGADGEDWTFGLYFGDGITNITDKFRFKREEDKVKFILRFM